MTRSASIDRSSAAPARSDDLAVLRVIAEASGDVAFVIDCADKRIRYLSPAADQLLGDSAGDLQACIDEPASASHLAPLADALRRGMAGRHGSSNADELDIQRADGSTVSVQVVSTLVVDAAGMAVSLTGIIRDHSAVQSLHAEQKRFASMLNHEFRTPLAVIDGAIQRLEATAVGADDATRQRYRKIGAAVDRLIAMLDEYLSPDRMAALGKTRAATGVDLGALLEEAAGQARGAGRPVTLAASALPSALRADQQGLRLVLKVLVDNAIAFSPAGSPIELSGRRVANGVELSVRDHGPGVPAADAPRIFDKSYRGSNADCIPGSGLGLYMARSVVEVHGGTLELADLASGGALFKIWMPTTLNGGKVVASAEPSSDNRLNRPGRRP